MFEQVIVQICVCVFLFALSLVFSTYIVRRLNIGKPVNFELTAANPDVCPLCGGTAGALDSYMRVGLCGTDLRCKARQELKVLS